MKKYVFRKYNPKYKAFFASEKRKIAKALDKKTKIEHVGSTAVPNLGGKGIVDIAVGVSKLADAKSRLEKAGYEFREKASYPGRLFFRRDYAYRKKKRRIHIHLTKFNSTDWKEMVGFRDYLLSHPQTVEQYAKIKRDAVKKALGDGEKYRKHKKKFIKKILRRVTSQTS